MYGQAYPTVKVMGQYVKSVLSSSENQIRV